MGNMTTLQILQGIHDWVLDKIDEETANFITKTVNDLVNYYTKTEVDTKVVRLQTQVNERNVTVEAQDAPSADTLTYTNALGETVNHIVGDKRIVPNPDAESGYDSYELFHLANGVATWGVSGGNTDIRQKLWVNLLSNQQGDTDLNGVTVKVEADNETILDTTWQGDSLFCKISPLKHVVVTVGSKSGYYLASNSQEFDASVAGERTINFNYETCVVKFQPVSNQGATDTTIESATGTINGIAVNYGDTVKVAMGQSITVSCDAITNYVTPTQYTGTASAATLTPILVYQTTLVTISWESNLGTDPVIDAVQATVAGRTVSSGETIKVATGSSVDVVFPDVEGYRTPSIATFVAEGTTVVKPTVQYSTEVLTISITKDAGDGDLSTCSVAVTNSGTTLGTLTNASPTLKIAYGINYTCTPSALAGYTAPAAVTKNWADTTAKSLTFEYEEQAGFVDLGLPSGLKWAQANIVKDAQGNYAIGENPEDYGCYFSWGNIVGHNNGEGYDFGTSNSGPYASTPGKQVSANIASNDAQHDAALALLGSPWRLPTKEEFQELYDNTDREWTTINGINGWKFMKKSDHSVFVFFPAAGRGYGTSIYGVGSYGYYWSSSWYSASSAFDMYFLSSSVYPQTYDDRYYGFSVRAVQ